MQMMDAADFPQSLSPTLLSHSQSALSVCAITSNITFQVTDDEEERREFYSHGGSSSIQILLENNEHKVSNSQGFQKINLHHVCQIPSTVSWAQGCLLHLVHVVGARYTFC